MSSVSCTSLFGYANNKGKGLVEKNIRPKASLLPVIPCRNDGESGRGRKVLLPFFLPVGDNFNLLAPHVNVDCPANASTIQGDNSLFMTNGNSKYKGGVRSRVSLATLNLECMIARLKH